MNLKTVAKLLLIFDAMVWGLSYPTVKFVLTAMTPMNLTFQRSLLATLFFLPFIIFFHKNRTNLLKLLPFGMILGILHFISYLTHTIGMQTIPSGQSAFLTKMYVVFVPVIAPFFGYQFPKKFHLISVCIALFGLYVITDPFHSDQLAIGDLWTIISAMIYSVYIYTQRKIVNKYQNYSLFAFYQIACIFVFSFISLTLGGHFSPIPSTFKMDISLIYLSIFSMLGTLYIQTKFQPRLKPEQVTMIYTLDPLFAIIFGYLLLREKITLHAIVGGSLILLAVIYPTLHRFLFKEDREIPNESYT